MVTPNNALALVVSC